MSLPVIKKIIPFDATQDYEIEFSWSGNQVYGNEIVIIDNSTNDIVYNDSLTSFQLNHTIPANTLTNGSQYIVKLRVWDINNTYSDYSNPLLFQCLSTPIVEFTNLESNQIIRNSYYNFTFSYTQSEGELLNEYQIILYDSNKNQLSTTGILYVSNQETLSGTLSDFLDNTQYYARITGSTVNGVEVDSGYIPFSVDYIAPQNWGKLVLENTNDGAIKISSNVILITGKSTKDPPVYLDNTKVDLTDGSKIYFDEDFTIDNNFDSEIIGQAFTPYSTIAEYSNSNNKIEVLWMLGRFMKNGDPSPDNPQEITGVDSLTISDSDGNTQTIDLPQTLYSVSDDVYDEYDAVSGTGTQRVGVAVLDGTENWSTNEPWDTEYSGYLHCYTRLPGKLTQVTDIIISDKFPIVYTWKDYTLSNCIYSERNTQYIYIFISTDLLETPDRDGLKSWLSENPVTVLYQLKEPQPITGTAQNITNVAGTVSIKSNNNATIIIKDNDKIIASGTSIKVNTTQNNITSCVVHGNTTQSSYQQAYVVLNIYNSFLCSRICSDPINVPSDDQQVCIRIKKENNMYDLKVEII